MTSSSRILEGVELGPGHVIEDFCVIGVLPRGAVAGLEKTVIGADVLIRSHTVIYTGNRIGDRFQTGNKVNIREANTIGDDVSIGTLTVLEHHIRIGDRVRLHSQVFVPEYTVIESDAWIGPNVVFTNAKYPGSPDAKRNLAGVYIHRFARIGANATLLPGITVGPEAVVGAGSVVTNDVPQGWVVAGNPARKIRTVSELPYQ